ncbi:MAG: hypothetical protein ACOH1E_05985 [Brevundimonas sp.]
MTIQTSPAAGRVGRLDDGPAAGARFVIDLSAVDDDQTASALTD